MNASALPIVRSVTDLRESVRDLRKDGAKIGMVPTMGALHEGHLTLVRHVLDKGMRAVVSIFVNPTQFGPNEDYSKYPRQEAEDAAKLKAAGANLLFAPGVTDMYADGFSTAITVSGVSEGLCGAFRPGHFQGVATVVAKLLLQCQPDYAVFGEKDYQQLQVIKRMVKDIDIPVEIGGFPTVREADGLAMSSRNAYLSADERKAAPVLHKTLTEIAQGLADGAEAGPLLEKGRAAILAAGFKSIDYLEACDADNLKPISRLERPGRILVAARLGQARLIDNIAALPKR